MGWSHASIMHGGSGCKHMPIYVICIPDSKEECGMRREVFYDRVKEMEINGTVYTVPSVSNYNHALNGCGYIGTRRYMFAM
jgi:hypothetical protein